jgi:hypothetical protein
MYGVNTVFFTVCLLFSFSLMQISWLLFLFGREITKYTVVYGVYVQFWPTLFISNACLRQCQLAKAMHTKLQHALLECSNARR